MIVDFRETVLRNYLTSNASKYDEGCRFKKDGYFLFIKHSLHAIYPRFTLLMMSIDLRLSLGSVTGKLDIKSKLK